MKSFALLTLAAAAFAAPAVPVLDERQFGGGFGGGRGGGFGGGLGGGLGGRVGSTANEFTSGGCRDIIMIFARGSTEVGNMGTVVGPPVANELKSRYGADRVAAEGVPYAAALAPNALPGGTDSQSRDLMKNLITKAAADCPKSAIVVGGYSQGAAVTHRAVENLPQATKDQIAAAFTFGDTQKVQDRNQIPNFDPAKTNVICNPGDAVCLGTLTILPAHLDYTRRANEQVDFIEKALTAAGVSR